MSPKRNDPVAPPVIRDEWQILDCTTQAVDGLRELENRAANNLRAAWEVMPHGPGRPTERHHQLRRGLATEVLEHVGAHPKATD